MGPSLHMLGHSWRRRKWETCHCSPTMGTDLIFSAHVFLLKDEMCRFLEGHQANRLLQAVLQDLKTPQYLAGCKALGLILQLVTTPLWCLIEDKTIGIFQMNMHWPRIGVLSRCCHQWSEKFYDGATASLQVCGKWSRSGCFARDLAAWSHGWNHPSSLSSSNGQTMQKAVCRLFTYRQIWKPKSRSFWFSEEHAKT